jgi:glyoxylate reductase
VFVTCDLGGLGVAGLLTPLQERAQVHVWDGARPPSPEDLRLGAAEADGLLCLLTDRVDQELIAACHRLRVISSMSAGVDHIDLAAAERRGIPVGHTPGVLTETTADLTWAVLLAAARRIPESDQMVRRGGWTPDRPWAPDMLLGRDLHGSTLGLVGLGAIGRAVARRAEGFGMTVIGWSRSGREVPGVESVALEDLWGRSDFVSVHVALADETRRMIGSDEIAAMRRGAVLVNTARGGIVDETALARALEAGHLGAAALDVFENQPLAPRSPLLKAPNLLLTPHIGSASVRTRQRMAQLAVDNLVAGLDGSPLVHRVV